MRVAVTTLGEDLDSEVDPRFGRAKQFIIVDMETMSYDLVSNTQSLNLPQGAGIQAAQNILPFKPKALLTGNCGPKAFKVLQAAGIEVVVGVKGKIRDVLKAYAENRYEPARDPNVEGHWV
ncbi:MAG: NifB/NifX family molybdenum-iron cluster-binding protein [Deltaproteobacteria bacterium]|nr:NifB/NifX family molybdenum-iron cluster-binding protein [Deltaproteobacteria bacterium]